MYDFEFIGINELNESAFKRHPIWLMYEDPEQEEDILSWGVNYKKAWNNKKENKEQEYYYPFLGSKCPSLVRGVYIYCKVTLATGENLYGYLSGGFSFGIYAKNKKYTFNKNMPDYAKETAAVLSKELNLKKDSLSCVIFEPLTNLYSKSVAHEKFW